MRSERALAEIELSGVGKTYADGTRALSDLDLEIPDGELMVLVGPSGCGKTTTLMLVAGLEELTEGEISIGGRVVNDIAPMDRDLAMVFQNYALYPHMSVYQNLAFGLRMRKLPKNEIDRRVREAARILGLTSEMLAKKPKNLSGGQRQRVAMGRAIVRQPSAYLMDEPLSNLDAALRVEMRAEISRLQRELGVTTLYVTHDQTEAMTLGDQVACFRDGSLQQVGPPQKLYMEPANLFVARFMGSPAMNLTEALVTQAADGSVVMQVGFHSFPITRETPQHDGIESRVGETIVLGIRPEDIEDACWETTGSKSRVSIEVEVNLREAMGAETHVHFDLPGWVPPAIVEQVTAETTDDEIIADDLIRSARLVGRLSPRTEAREGHRLELSFDTSAIQAFDLETGRRL